MSTGERKTLARWVAMVSISLEYNGRLIVSLQGQRTELMRGEVPGGWRVFVGTLPDGKNAGRSHASAMTMPMGTFPGEYLQIHSIYFVVERAMFHAYYSVGEFAFRWLPYLIEWSEEQSPLAKLWLPDSGFSAQKTVTSDEVLQMQRQVKGTS